MFIDFRDVASCESGLHDWHHKLKIGNTLAILTVGQAVVGLVVAWWYGRVVLDARLVELFGYGTHGFIAPGALAGLLVVYVQHFGVMPVSYQFDLCVRKRVAQRAFG